MPKFVYKLGNFVDTQAPECLFACDEFQWRHQRQQVFTDDASRYELLQAEQAE